MKDFKSKWNWKKAFFDKLYEIYKKKYPKYNEKELFCQLFEDVVEEKNMKLEK